MTDITAVRLPKIYLVEVHPFRSVGSGYDIRILVVSTLPTIYYRSLEFGRGIQNNNIKKGLGRSSTMRLTVYRAAKVWFYMWVSLVGFRIIVFTADTWIPVHIRWLELCLAVWWVISLLCSETLLGRV